jgi:hypothetical protein
MLTDDSTPEAPEVLAWGRAENSEVLADNEGMSLALRATTTLTALLACSGCGGSTSDEGSGAPSQFDAGNEADTDAGVASDAAGQTDALGDAPFDGPCEPEGTWLVEYETVGVLGCDLLQSKDTLHVEYDHVPPLYVEGGQPKGGGVSIPDCKLHVGWSYYYEESGELNGYSNELELTLTSPNTAAGTLVHGEYWWCGGTFASDTFVAHAERQ